MTQPTTQTIVLGAGTLYFDIESALGALTGERFLGDTPGFELQVVSETVTVFDSDGPIAEKIVDVAVKVERSATITAQHISVDNLALFLIGDTSSRVQTVTAVTNEVITAAVQGRWYQLGATAADPIGNRLIGAVVVTGPGATPTWVNNTDYILDLTLGRIYIVVGGGINGTNLEVDYTKPAKTYDQITSNNLGAKNGALRFIAANTIGENRDLYIPKVQMRPSGALAFKSRDTVQQMQFDISVAKRGALAQLYLNGRPT